MPHGNSCLPRPRRGDFNLTLLCCFLERKRERRGFRSSFCVPMICRPCSALARQSSSVRYCRSAPNLEPSSALAKRVGCGALVNRQSRISVDVCCDSFLRTKRENKTGPDPPLAITECRNPRPFLGLAIRLKSIAPENSNFAPSHHPCPYLISLARTRASLPQRWHIQGPILR
jgi:hypothetical protein